MKKLSVSAKILNLLNTKGGFKPKDIIKETKLKPASVYTTLNVLRNQGKIAKEEDGVYISQTQTSTTEPTKVLTSVNKNNGRKYTFAKRGNRPNKAKPSSTNKLKQENDQLHQFCLEWRNKCDAQQKEIARLQHLYMDSQAVVRYLESKIEQLFKD
jgi:Fe2+ or Zn2+ uptake regulation protein